MLNSPAMLSCRGHAAGQCSCSSCLSCATIAAWLRQQRNQHHLLQLHHWRNKTIACNARAASSRCSEQRE